MEAQTQTEKKPLFTNRALVRLIVPLMIEQLLAVTVGVADTVMVTSAGEAAVSGVSLVDGINILLINICAALGTGGAVVVSQYIGRQDLEKARSAAKQLMYVSCGVALAIMVIAMTFRQQILDLLFGHVSEEIMVSALVYFLLTAAAYPFMAVYNAGAALFRAMGNSQVSMVISAIVNVVNVAVNYICIHFYGMGAAGAGLGTLVSRIVAAVVISVLIVRKDQPVYIENIFRPQFRWPTVRAILSIGVPAGVENSMFQVGKLLVLNLITSFDVGVELATVGSAVAANAIANSISGLVIVSGSAMGLAMVTVVGQCMGAGDEEQAKGYIKKIMTASCLAMGVTNLAVFFALPVLLPLFNLTPATQAMAQKVLSWSCLAHAVLWPPAFVLPNALRAAGDAKFTMTISMLAMWTCRIGLSYLLGAPWGMNMGLLGVWVAMFSDWVVRIIFFLPRIAGGKWKEHRVVE